MANNEKAVKSNGLHKILSSKWMGIPSGIFFILLAISLVLIYLPDGDGVQGGYLEFSFLGVFACVSVLAVFITVIGDRIPIWNKYVGGGLTLTMFVISGMAGYGLIPEVIQDNMNVFYNSNPANFMEMQIAFLIIGSVLSIDRNLLLRSLKGYFPMVVIGVFGAGVCGILVGFLFGYNPLDTILNFVIPIMGAGIGTGAIPMQEMMATQTQMDASVWFTNAVVTLSIANVVCIIAASLLNELGKKRPGLTGKTIMRSAAEDEAAQNEQKPAHTITVEDIFASAVITGMVLLTAALISDFWGKLFPSVQIHRLAFFVIFCVILNALQVIPQYLKETLGKVQGFFAKYAVCTVLACAGLSIDFRGMVENFSPVNLVIILAVVGGCIAFSMFTGRFFGFNPIDITITSGLCMANSSGSGDIMVLGASDRMHLMPYAQISTRIGGAFMLILASVFFSFL